MTKEHKNKIGLANKIGRRKFYQTSRGKEQAKNHSIRMSGRKLSVETRKKISLAMRGSKTHLWKGGVWPKNKLIRKSLEYRLWRESVFERDGYTCIWCGHKGGNLNSDHIKPFAFFPELRFAIDNGRTLCVPCHRKTETYSKTKVID